jgi:hypothetical protein
MHATIEERVMQPVSKERFGKYVSAATDTKATTEERWFRCGPCRGEKRKTNAWVCNWATPFLGDVNKGTPPQHGTSLFRMIKFVTMVLVGICKVGTKETPHLSMVLELCMPSILFIYRKNIREQYD